MSLGEPVVLDASWTDARWREAAADLARETTCDFVELRCVAPAALAADGDDLARSGRWGRVRCHSRGGGRDGLDRRPVAISRRHRHDRILSAVVGTGPRRAGACNRRLNASSRGAPRLPL